MDRTSNLLFALALLALSACSCGLRFEPTIPQNGPNLGLLPNALSLEWPAPPETDFEVFIRTEEDLGGPVTTSRVRLVIEMPLESIEIAADDVEIVSTANMPVGSVLIRRGVHRVRISGGSYGSIVVERATAPSAFAEDITIERVRVALFDQRRRADREAVEAPALVAHEQLLPMSDAPLVRREAVDLDVAGRFGELVHGQTSVCPRAAGASAGRPPALRGNWPRCTSGGSRTRASVLALRNTSAARDGPTPRVAAKQRAFLERQRVYNRLKRRRERAIKRIATSIWAARERRGGVAA